MMKNTVENNLRAWDLEYGWPKDGDEWDGQARLCAQSYDEWKKSLVETFIKPNLTPESVLLEIAPGHGRWSKEMVQDCREMILVDLSPNCIDYCRTLFAGYEHVRYFVNDGKSLHGVEGGGVDFVWSYDAFVHMDEETIGHYLSEILRVLRPGGKAILHHAGRRHALLGLGFLQSWGKPGKRFHTFLSMGTLKDSDGWRSNLSKKRFKDLATERGLRVEAQRQRWGKNNEFGVPRFGDCITLLRKCP
jgi:ubiquinone/menaquinone biosynthesis C-methylase UbiE